MSAKSKFVKSEVREIDAHLKNNGYSKSSIGRVWRYNDEESLRRILDEARAVTLNKNKQKKSKSAYSKLKPGEREELVDFVVASYGDDAGAIAMTLLKRCDAGEIARWQKAMREVAKLSE